MMSTEAAPPNALIKAFDDYQETAEFRDMASFVQASKPSAVLFMAFSAGWVAHRSGGQALKDSEQDEL